MIAECYNQAYHNLNANQVGNAGDFTSGVPSSQA
jgi:hypothetical protein